MTRGERQLVQDLVRDYVRASRRWNRRVVPCLKCGRETTRRLDDSVGVCAACE